MNKIVFISLVILLTNSCLNFTLAQSDETLQTDSVIDLIGDVKREQLQSGEFGIFFSEEYKNYQPDQYYLNKLDPAVFNREITIVLATWCSDSQEQVPRFFKILDSLNYDTRSISIICVDREKTAIGIDIESMNIERVPTFIISGNGSENGRIIETPDNSLESDLSDILNK